MGVANLDFEDMIENAPCGYITLRAERRIEHVNRTFLGMDRSRRGRDAREALQ